MIYESYQRIFCQAIQIDLRFTKQFSNSNNQNIYIIYCEIRISSNFTLTQHIKFLNNSLILIKFRYYAQPGLYDCEKEATSSNGNKIVVVIHHLS